MNSKISVALIVAALTVAAPVQAELKVGYVSMDRILREAPVSIKASKRIEAEFLRREQELKKLEQTAKSAQADYEKNAVTLPETERRRREREISELTVDFERKRREFNEDLHQRRNDELKSIVDAANGVLKQIAETEKFDLILQDAAYISPRLDITDKVIKSLADVKDAGK